eukprot:362246_1
MTALTTMSQPYDTHQPSTYYKCGDFVSSQLLEGNDSETINMVVYQRDCKNSDNEKVVIVFNNKAFCLKPLVYNEADEAQLSYITIEDLCCDDYFIINPIICGYNVKEQSICLHFQESIKYHNYQQTSSQDPHQWFTNLNTDKFDIKHKDHTQEDIFRKAHPTRMEKLFYLCDDYYFISAEVCGCNDDKSKIMIRFSAKIKEHNTSSSSCEQYQWFSRLNDNQFFHEIGLLIHEDCPFEQLKHIKSVSDLFENANNLIELLEEEQIENAFKVLLDDQYFNFGGYAWNNILSFLQTHDNYSTTQTNKFMSRIIDSCDGHNNINDNHILSDCDALNAITFIMKNTNPLNNNHEFKYSNSKLIQHFHHLLTYHNTDKQFDFIHRTVTRYTTIQEYETLNVLSLGYLRIIDNINVNFLESIQNIIVEYNTIYSECSINSCVAIQRNYGGRHGNDEQRENDPLVKNDMYTKEILREELFDQIHCYYYHSYHLQHRRNSHKSNIKIPNKKCNINEMIQRRRSNKFKQIDKNTQLQKTYSFGYAYDYYQKSNKWVIHRKYQNLKQELLHNVICVISIEQFDCLLEKAKCLLTSGIIYAHRVIESSNRIQSRNINDELGIVAYSHITIQHLIAVMVYCNLDKLQFKLSKTYRKNACNESDNSLKTRHSNYYHVGKLLRECVKMYGTKIESMWNEYKIFYHGMSETLMLPTSIDCKMYGPFSTSVEWLVAVQFSNNKGLILEITPNDDCVYFNCELISNFTSEKEKLFIGGCGAMQFTDIVQAPSAQSYKVYLKAMDYIHKLVGAKFRRHHGDPLLNTPFAVLPQTMKQLICRIILNELHHYKSNGFPELKSCPEYVAILFHQYCLSKRYDVHVFVQREINHINDFWKLFVDQKWNVTNWIDTVYLLFPSITRFQIQIECKDFSNRIIVESQHYLNYLLDISEFIERENKFEFEGCYNGDGTTKRRERFHEVKEMTYFLENDINAKCCRVLVFTLSKRK